MGPETWPSVHSCFGMVYSTLTSSGTFTLLVSAMATHFPFSKFTADGVASPSPFLSFSIAVDAICTGHLDA